MKKVRKEGNVLVSDPIDGTTIVDHLGCVTIAYQADKYAIADFKCMEKIDTILQPGDYYLISEGAGLVRTGL